MKVIIPAYKRPEYVGRCLDSLGEYGGVLVVDDGTPGNALAPVLAARKLSYLRVEHGGMVRALAAGIEAMDPADDDIVLLLANDHELPQGWRAALTLGAREGFGPHQQTGQIDHIPGLRPCAKWRSQIVPITHGLGIRTGLTRWKDTCSLPSLMSGSAARGFAQYIRAGNIDPDTRQPFSAQKTYQKYFTEHLSGQTFFYLMGASVKIDHFGHNRGLRPGWIKSDEHEEYYREIGRRR